jgi:hypothetical protein
MIDVIALDAASGVVFAEAEDKDETKSPTVTLK